MRRLKHTYPVGTLLTFVDDPYLWEVSYQDVLYCSHNCKIDHDCYEVPYIAVHRGKGVSNDPTVKNPYVGTAFPIKDIDKVLYEGNAD